jgi:predicted AlkP superfamily pyrophosphatase or phosphodiesterase
MKRYFLLFLAFVMSFSSCVHQQQGVSRPKLVVGLVIDQMRWDYLYRYESRYGNDGFKRLMRDGFNCENTMINYLPSFTAPGHACIYTGSVPSINGIAGNNWIDNLTGKSTYCVDDTTVSLAGDEKKAPSMSPRNLLTTTITDELRLATNFRSRVYGIAIKDRGAILPAGHTANAAYWYNDKTGDFVTSSYYDKQFQNPAWLQAFNKRGIADSLVKQNWQLLYDAASYTQSTKDLNGYEEPFKGEKDPVFPHKLSELGKADRLGAVKAMPAGNTLTFMMAKACMEGAEGGQLGSSTYPDFLCVSLSSTDYVGHQFAPNSVEIEDMYLRLDKEIASFLNYLDKSLGKGNYLLFLTADHGGAHNPQFLKDKNVPAGVWFNVVADLNMYLKEQFKKEQLVRDIMNYQVFLNESVITGDASLNREKIKASIQNWLVNIMPVKYNVSVSYVMDMEDMNKTAVPEPIRTMAINGYNHLRSGSLQIVLNPGWFEADRFTGTTHGTWNPYDAHVPLLWYGWHVGKGKTDNQLNMIDISATIAALLHIQMPNGCIGKPISEVVKSPNP